MTRTPEELRKLALQLSIDLVMADRPDRDAIFLSAAEGLTRHEHDALLTDTMAGMCDLIDVIRETPIGFKNGVPVLAGALLRKLVDIYQLELDAGFA